VDLLCQEVTNYTASIGSLAILSTSYRTNPICLLTTDMWRCRHNVSSSDRAAHCCLNRPHVHLRLSISAICPNIHIRCVIVYAKNLDSQGYVFVARSMGLAAVNSVSKDIKFRQIACDGGLRRSSIFPKTKGRMHFPIIN